jgi:hypothetical protein
MWEESLGCKFAETAVWKLTAGQPGWACAQAALATTVIESHSQNFKD